MGIMMPLQPGPQYAEFAVSRFCMYMNPGVVMLPRSSDVPEADFANVMAVVPTVGALALVQFQFVPPLTVPLITLVNVPTNSPVVSICVMRVRINGLLPSPSCVRA